MAGTKQDLDGNTSQTKPSGHPAQNIPNHPLLIQLIVVQYLQSRIDDRMSEDRAFRPLGENLSGIRRRGSPYGEEEEKEQFAQGGVEQRQWDVRKPIGNRQRDSKRRRGRHRSPPKLLSDA